MVEGQSREVEAETWEMECSGRVWGSTKTKYV